MHKERLGRAALLGLAGWLGAGVYEAKPRPPKVERLLVEVETRATTSDRVRRHTSDEASGGGYVAIRGWHVSAPDYGRAVAGETAYPIEVPFAGEWSTWVRARWSGTCANSVTLAAASEGEPERHLVGNDAVQGRWHWVAGPRLKLGAGTQTLLLGTRESAAEVDAIMLTNDPAVRPEDGWHQRSHRRRPALSDGFVSAARQAQGLGALWTPRSGRWRVTPAGGMGMAWAEGTPALATLVGSAAFSVHATVSVESTPEDRGGVQIGEGEEALRVLLGGGALEIRRGERVLSTTAVDDGWHRLQVWGIEGHWFAQLPGVPGLHVHAAFEAPPEVGLYSEGTTRFGDVVVQPLLTRLDRDLAALSWPAEYGIVTARAATGGLAGCSLVINDDRGATTLLTFEASSALTSLSVLTLDGPQPTVELPAGPVQIVIDERDLVLVVDGIRRGLIPHALFPPSRWGLSCGDRKATLLAADLPGVDRYHAIGALRSAPRPKRLHGDAMVQADLPADHEGSVLALHAEAEGGGYQITAVDGRLRLSGVTTRDLGPVEAGLVELVLRGDLVTIRVNGAGRYQARHPEGPRTGTVWIGTGSGVVEQPWDVDGIFHPELMAVAAFAEWSATEGALILHATADGVEGLLTGEPPRAEIRLRQPIDATEVLVEARLFGATWTPGTSLEIAFDEERVRCRRVDETQTECEVGGQVGRRAVATGATPTITVLKTASGVMVDADHQPVVKRLASDSRAPVNTVSVALATSGELMPALRSVSVGRSPRAAQALPSRLRAYLAVLREVAER